MRCSSILRLAAIGVFVVHVTPAVAQNGSWAVSLPSPTAASLGRFSDVPVSLYTGLPTIDIPLFTARGRTLQLPIGLDYHAAGIRVEEFGGWVGLGWKLEAGGAITRSVRGLADEWSNGYLNFGRSLYNPSIWPTTPPSSALLSNIAANTGDGEPDQYFFTFAGRTGEFFYGPTDSIPGAPTARLIPYQNWRIAATLSGAMIVRWVITTDDGTRYTFGAVEQQTSYNPGPLSNQPYASAWHLTGIRAPGGDSITLEYQNYTAYHEIGAFGERKDEVPSECGGPGGGINRNRYQTTVPRLSVIRTAAHTITFYDSLRLDAQNAGEPRLDRIVVATPSGVVQRQFKLVYDYSIGDASNPRLTLRNVFEQDRNGVPQPPYSFDYSGPTLPSYFSYAIDHGGFYNGRTSNSTLFPPGRSPTNMPGLFSGQFYAGADRNPDSVYMKAGVLTRITYPTGGYSEFVYEPHDYSYSFVAGQLTFIDSVARAAGVISNSGTSGTQSTPFTVVGTAATPVQVSVYVSSVYSCPGCPFAEIRNAQGQVVAGPWNASITTAVTLSPGQYTVQANRMQAAVVQANLSWYDYFQVPRRMASGLRIAELRTADAMGNITTRRYRYRLQSDTSRSSGFVPSEPKYDHWFYDPQLVPPGVPQSCRFWSRSVMPRIALGGGSPVSYSEVMVFDGASGEYGRSRHVFYVLDRPPEYWASDSWPFHRRSSPYWRWGQEIRAEHYDASGRLQRLVESQYAFPTDTQTTRELHGISVSAWPTYWPMYTWASFRVESAWKYLSRQTTTHYDTLGVASFASSVYYTHGNPNHAQLTETIEEMSDGSQRITRLRYPRDYASGTANPEAAAITAMQGTAHMQSAIIERVVSRRVGASEQVVEAILTTFREFALGQYAPYQRFILNNPSPIP
jgi:hypothetical protein